MLKNLFTQKPAFQEVDPYKISYNVGSLLDIPTGKYVKGIKGENILLGGLALITAIVGRGNTFKSTIEHYMLLSAAEKIAQSGYCPYINTYDTEMNIDKKRLQSFVDKFKALSSANLLESGAWSITDKTMHLGNEWFKILKNFLKEEKIKNKNKYLVDTPILGKDGQAIKTVFPSFGEIDSISEFETADIEDIMDKSEIGESSGNTLHMRLGLAKTRLLMELPALCNSASHYLIMTAHLGDNMNIQATPYSTPAKKLQHLKVNEKIKGVTEKFFFLPNVVWQTVNCSTLINQNTKEAEFPKSSKSDLNNTDLNVVTLKLLRNKFGPSGYSVDLVVSQGEGVLSSLSEFLFIKENSRFGLQGNNVHYNLTLYPSEKLSRTTIREKIEQDPKLVRALKFTADILQIKQIMIDIDVEIPPLEQLYEKLNKKYGFDKLLNTRDYWTFNQYEHEVPFLSTLDLIYMYHDKYTPYWLK